MPLPKPSELWKKVPTHMRLFAEGLVGVKAPITNDDFTTEELDRVHQLVTEKTARRAARNAYLRDPASIKTPEQYASFPDMVAGPGGTGLVPVPYERYKDQKRRDAEGQIAAVDKVPIKYDSYPEFSDDGKTGLAAIARDTVKSFKSVDFRLASSLGAFNAYNRPDGTIEVQDTYDWNTPGRPLKAKEIADVAASSGGGLIALGDAIAYAKQYLGQNISRPVKLVLPAKGMVTPNE